MHDDDKDDLRERLRTRRRELADAVRAEASREVCERLESWAAARDPRSVAGYLSFDNEVDVEPYLERRLEGDTRVALPRVLDDESMEYVDVDGLDEVEEGAFGIREPVGEPCEIGGLELFLVPGVGFDRDGGRIGMGWGYYDRALARRRASDTNLEAVFVGVCYDCQLSDEPLPTEEHDVEMDAVVTQHERIRCSSPAASE